MFSGAELICPLGGKGIIRNNSDVKSESDGMLTTADKPITDGTGVCAAHEGAPCSPVPTVWIGASSTVESSGHSALLSDSTILCTAGGGMIKILQQNNQVFNDYTDDHSAPDIENSPKESSFAGVAVAAMASGITAVGLSDSISVSETNKVDYNEGADSEETTPNSAQCRTKCWCCGECPTEFEEKCEFRKSPDNKMLISSDAAKLKSNSEKAFPDIYPQLAAVLSRVQYKMEDAYRVDTSVAHHHLIPGNECYGRKKKNGEMYYPLLIKLGNLFQYNINCAENGILLPSFSNIQLSRMMEQEKPRLFYFIMDKDIANSEPISHLEHSKRSIIASQLHVGQHSYE